MLRLPPRSQRTDTIFPDPTLCRARRTGGRRHSRAHPHTKPSMPDGAPPSAPFFNRQALHLRPDPSRVVVRPFRPAVEPRDLHPVDKTRANHIVDRVLAMTADETDALLAETLRNFDDRTRDRKSQRLNSRH